MDEKLIAQVLQIEERAQEIQQTARREKSRQLEILATSNLDRAVAYVLERVAGRG
jgi:hypothetical protein